MSDLLSAPISDRPLIAFAFLAQTSYTDGDILSSLAPIFKPIAKAREGQVFEPHDFSQVVAKVFGIEVHPWAVEDLAPRLERTGLLKRVQTSANTHQFVYAQISQSFSEVSETDIRGVVNRFISFAEPILRSHAIEVDPKALEEGFLDQLVRVDFLSILIKPDRSAEAKKGADTLSLPKSPQVVAAERQQEEQSRIDVLSAAFILHLYYEDRPVHELLVRITSGALLAEVVLNFQDPGNSAKLDKLRIVLDAPFLMSVLDVSSEESHQYAKKILDSLVEHGASIATFRHYTEEIKLNLQAVIRETHAGRGFRATSRRLSSRAFESYATAVAQDVSQALLALNIRIIDPPKSAASFQYFSQEDEDQFYSSLGTYVNQQAQRRDAATLAGIMRYRANKRVRMNKFYQTDYLFITDNPSLADQSRAFLKKRKLFEDGEVPPVMTDRYLAGLLWVVYGGKASELGRYRLLANCAAALDLRSDVVNKTHRFLSEIDQQKADRFRALMTTERASQHLMQLTLGDSLLVSRENAINLLDDIEAAYSQKYRQEADAKIEEILRQNSSELQALEATRAAEYRALLQTSEDLRSRAFDAQAHLLQEREASKRREQAFAEERARREKTEILIIERSARSAIVIEKLAIGAFAIVFAIVIGYITYIPIAHSTIAEKLALPIAIAAGAVGLIGFWKIPDIVFGTLSRRVRNFWFYWRMRSIDDSDWHAGYVVDWTTLKATAVSNSGQSGSQGTLETNSEG